MKVLRVVIALALVFCLASPSWGSVGVKQSNNNIGVATDIDFEPGTNDSFDGSTYKVYEAGPLTGTSTIVSTVSQLSAANLGFGLLQLNGASKTFSMVAGLYQGQEITLLKMEQDANTLKLNFSIDNPNIAHTGFTSVTWSTAVGGWVTLVWMDATVGWVITGASPSGVTITY